MSQVSPTQTPLLIYDGDCSFCKFWVEHWKSLTDSYVSYAPYQEVADQFPEIPLAAFQAAVQFIDRQGTIWSGAEAVFRSLACVPEKRWLLWCYRRVPGFAPVSNFIYRFVARHRGAFYRLSRLLCGRHME